MADRLNRSKKYFKAGLALGGYNGSNAAAGDCFYVEDQDPDSKPIQTSAPRDPNAIYGATGYGTQQYLNSASGKLGYTVHFENVATATASAQKVTVTDTLDKTKFDLANFHLVNFSIGDSLYTMPPALQQFTRIVKIKQFSNVNVLFNAKLDTATGILTCTYMSVDPLTNELVDEASLLGFLPPNTSNAKGEGSVSYAVPLKRLASGTVVPNRAGIVFDRYASIITNTWTNTLDTTKPANTVLTTQRVNDTTMRLSFNSSDAHSGMQRYDVFASTNNGPYIYAGSITDTARLIGKVDSTYSFYGVPADNVGNLGSISNIAIVKLTGATTTQSDKLLVYPNPVHRSATIVFSVVQQQTVAVKLYSMTGQLVASLYEGAASGSVRLTPDFSHLGNGVYILKVKGASGLQLQTKIIIQH
jgi:hypothetical protein